MNEIYNSLLNSFDKFLNSAKSVIANVITPCEGFFNLLVSYSTYIIIITFLLLLIFNVFIIKTDSVKHIKNVRTIVICGLLIALNCVLSIYSLNIGGYLKLSFGFVTLPAVSLLFGPITGCIVGFVQDIFSYIVRPTGAFMPIFSIISATSGLIYGMFFYRKKVTFLRTLIMNLVIVTVINILFNSIAMAPLMSKAIVAYLPARIVKNLIVWPIESVILYYFLKAVRTIK